MKKVKEKDSTKTENVEIGPPEKMDLQAAHRKVMMVMVGLFVAALLLMLALSDKVEFASTGGM
ncbi:MAG TPA: hypothetical protein DCG57_07955 [Candidatus Riflebacteria bacterium]|jgi:positive regulator of sigma E activity|nr:MAG: hypothetical protein CVV41_10265 [Candidatus Riflebacteria bacterium HGW-Riflebacteria-1]HAE38558.1 hypothetical protein [Candidatus Riflebacteria bacterium]